MTKTIQDFKEAALTKGIKKWIIHQCSMCGYPCGYVFNSFGIDLGYDSGCDCTHSQRISLREWYEVVHHYNSQVDERVIAEMNEFWGFNG